MLTGESQFHISNPLGIEPWSLITGSKQVDHWTSEIMYEYSEIAGSPQMDKNIKVINFDNLRWTKRSKR
jgi:hypothetical protein